MKLTRAYVMNDGGFEFGMDAVTPASWQFTRRTLKRGIYREWIMPGYMDAWCKQHPHWIGSLHELRRIADTLRHA